MFSFYLKDLPPFGKLFTAVFTTLMLCVCFWAMFILYVEEGMIDDEALPEYLEESYPDESGNEEMLPSEEEVTEDVELLSEDSLARLAPIWDSVLRGEDAVVDSTSMARYFPHADSQLAGYENENEEPDEDEEYWYDRLEHNIALAHTHINGQTLLYFALGLVFLFTSVKPRTKKIILGVFGGAVVMHAVGLSGKGFHWFFDDILAVSGVLILLVIPYICFTIYMELLKSSERKSN